MWESTITGLERWTGMVEWNGGIAKFSKIEVNALLKWDLTCIKHTCVAITFASDLSLHTYSVQHWCVGWLRLILCFVSYTMDDIYLHKQLLSRVENALQSEGAKTSGTRAVSHLMGSGVMLPPEFLPSESISKAFWQLFWGSLPVEIKSSTLQHSTGA